MADFLSYFRQYALPIFCLFLVVMGMRDLIKEKEAGKPILRRLVLTTLFTVVMLVIVTHIILRG